MKKRFWKVVLVLLMLSLILSAREIPKMLYYSNNVHQSFSSPQEVFEHCFEGGEFQILVEKDGTSYCLGDTKKNMGCLTVIEQDGQYKASDIFETKCIKHAVKTSDEYPIVRYIFVFKNKKYQVEPIIICKMIGSEAMSESFQIKWGDEPWDTNGTEFVCYDDSLVLLDGWEQRLYYGFAEVDANGYQIHGW